MIIVFDEGGMLCVCRLQKCNRGAVVLTSESDVVVKSELQLNTSGARSVHVLDNRSLTSPVPVEPSHLGVTCTNTTLTLVSAAPAGDRL